MRTEILEKYSRYIVNEHVVDFYKNCQKARISQTLDWREHPLWRRIHVRWVMLHALWTRARCRAKSYAQSKVLKLAAPPLCCKITASSLGTCVTCACSPLIRYVHVSPTVEAPVRPSVRGVACLLITRTRAFVANGWSPPCVSPWACLPFDYAHVHLLKTVEAPCACLLIRHTRICRKQLKRRASMRQRIQTGGL